MSKQEEILSIRNFMKLKDLEAFLKVLGSPTHISFWLGATDHTLLDRQVRIILPGFRGPITHIIKYNIALREPGVEGNQDYVRYILRAYKDCRDFSQEYEKKGADAVIDRKNTFHLESLAWDFDRLDMGIEINVNPQRIGINYNASEAGESDISRQVRREAEKREIPYLLVCTRASSTTE